MEIRQIGRTEGLQAAILGMRLPYESVSDSMVEDGAFVLGEDDRRLAIKLASGGSPHNKFMRQVVCWAEIRAPRYWWVEMDTYRMGVEKDSSSTMHLGARRMYSPEDFDTAQMSNFDKVILNALI